MKKSILPLFAVSILLCLLFQPSLAFQGAKNGLLLWAGVVVPTLLPFMLCVSFVTAVGGIGLITKPVFPIFSRLLKLSQPGTYVLLSGLLCGYPMGAKTCSEFLSRSLIGKREADYLFAICNQPSPMFLLGYVASKAGGFPLWKLLCAFYLPLIALAPAARRVYGHHVPEQVPLSENQPPFYFDEIMMSSYETMVRIGEYIMIFSILSLYLERLLSPFPVLQAALLGITEITTGVHAIAGLFPAASSVNAVETGYSALAVILITASVAFGGICGCFQTKSVIKNAGLSIRHYILWKILHSALSCIILILLIPN